MRITIETIPHENQRYDTCGDWVFTNQGNDLDINISEMKDKRSEFAVAIHEQVEAFLCQMAGITDKQVDDFDFNWPRTSAEYRSGKLSSQEVIDKYKEQGADPSCPCYIQHMIAEDIERMIIEALKMPWEEHERNVDALSTTVSREYSGSNSDSD